MRKQWVALLSMLGLAGASIPGQAQVLKGSKSPAQTKAKVDTGNPAAQAATNNAGAQSNSNLKLQTADAAAAESTGQDDRAAHAPTAGQYRPHASATGAGCEQEPVDERQQHANYKGQHAGYKGQRQHRDHQGQWQYRRNQGQPQQHSRNQGEPQQRRHYQRQRQHSNHQREWQYCHYQRQQYADYKGKQRSDQRIVGKPDGADQSQGPAVSVAFADKGHARAVFRPGLI